MTSKRDLEIIRHIHRYCGEIDEAIAFFGNDKAVFLNKAIYRDAAATPIEQIGDLVKRLSDDFLIAHPDVPWKAIKGMRTWFAHQYLTMDREIMWKVMQEDIPVLKAFCEKVIEGTL